MLEVFFDNPKVFSFFRELWNNDKDEIEVLRILYNLGLTPEISYEILKDFVFLGILSETDDCLETGVFKFNREAPIVLAIIIFGDIVEKFTIDKLLDDGEDDDLNELVDNLSRFIQYLKENGYIK